MSDAEGNPDAGDGATPGEEPAVNQEDNNAEVDPNDPLTGYKEALPMGGPPAENGAAAELNWSIQMPALVITTVPNCNDLRMTWDMEMQQIQMAFANLVQKMNLQFMAKF